jgi:hypothetical protein
MDEIRTFEESHTQDVANLEAKIFHGRRKAGAALRDYFAKIFLHNPWRDDEMQSLVYMHAGKIVGFAGVIPRRMVFRGEAVRVAVVSQLMVDSEEYRGMAGFEMVRRIFAGPQDLTVTDGATESACAVWTAAGARVAQLYSLQWLRVLRPLSHYRRLVAEHPRTVPASRALLSAAAPAFCAADSLLRKLPARALRTDDGGLICEPSDAGAILACIRKIGWREELAPCYDDVSFDWLLSEAAMARAHGALRMCTLREGNGSPAGWLIYYARSGGESNVLQMGASPRRFDSVIQAALHDAYEQGSTSVSGPLIPRALLNLANQQCGFRYIGNGVLAHSRNSDLLNCILRGDAAFSRLDGEWWMHFAVGDWK